MATENIYASLSANQRNGIISDRIKEVESRKSEIDNSITKEYISLLNDLSFVIDSIHKGVGNRWRNPDEDPAAVLEELREAFGYDYVAERTTSLLDIAEYEYETDRLVRLLADMTRL